MQHEDDKILPVEMVDGENIDMAFLDERRSLSIEQGIDVIVINSRRDLDTLIAALQSRRERMAE